MIKGRATVVIPCRNEMFINKTVEDILTKATGDLEVVVVLDEKWPDPPLPNHKKLIVLHNPRPMGMRACITRGVAIANGEYIFKSDGHCMFQEGFDEVLKRDMDDDWLVIPSRDSLDAENWCKLETGKSRVDYHYLCSPFFNKKDDDPGLHGVVWNERARQRRDKPEYDLDDEMSFQGSFWAMKKAYFDHLDGMPEEEYGTFIQEPQQLGLKVWLGGGRIVVNKKTTYYHLHKGKQYGRGYAVSGGELHRGSIYSADYWLNNRWEKRGHDFSWLIDKFSPVPTWPENWQEIWERVKHNWRKENGRWVFTKPNLEEVLAAV